MFTPRLTRPTAGNKYYIRKASGGYSNAIAGKVNTTGRADADCDVLANCVGYAYGRFNEIGGYGYCKYLSPVNAENFPEYSGGLQTGSEPKLGAVMVWKKGATLTGSDGAGHVCVVEQIFADGSIATSHSGWNSSAFWTETLRKGDGNWRSSWMGSAYTFRCFIYNPAVSDSEATIITLKNGARGQAVKDWQTKMNSIGYRLDVDGSFGPACVAACKHFQKEHGLEVDGVAGIATQTTLDQVITPAEPSYLAYGMRGEYVRALQENLNKLGYSLATDGSFGPATLAAVKDYQSKKGLAVDGSVGPATKAAIAADLEELALVLKQGSTGEKVKTLQSNLNTLGYDLAVDGSFGPATLAAVKDYQKRKGLTVDGVVGAAMRQVIQADLETYKNRNSAIKDLKIIVDGTERKCWATTLDKQDYIRLVDLDFIGLAKTINLKSIPEVTTK